MRVSRYLLAALVATLAIPATAAAAPDPVRDALRIADRYWGSHPCAGRVEVTIDPTLPYRRRGVFGEATGLAWTGSRWILASCTITIADDLDPLRHCITVFHEVGHLAHPANADHSGPMHSPGDAAACSTAPKGRAAIIDGIRRELPRGWRVNCTRSSPRMSCWARSRTGRSVRRYRASVRRDSTTWRELKRSPRRSPR